MKGVFMVRKKILFCVEAMGGGVFTYIVDLANELVNQYDVYIAYAMRKQTPADFKKHFDKRIHLISVNNFKRSISPYHDVCACFELIKIAKNIAPDIIHLHSSKAGVIGRLAFRSQSVPLFYTPHGYSFLMKNYSIPKRMMYRAIERICAHTKCTTISCSFGEHLETLKMTKRAIYIDNGINIKTLQQEMDTLLSQGVKTFPFTVFSIGRICHQKNPRLFNEIAEALPDIRFLWIGDGELRNELSAKNIEVTGWVTRNEVLQYALSADVFILPSLWEGLPISLLEMMYMKKPCIVSNVIGNRDVINNGVNGFVCESKEEFAQSIRTIQKKYPHEFIEKAYAEICEHYNVTKMAEQYEQAYFSK